MPSRLAGLLSFVIVLGLAGCRDELDEERQGILCHVVDGESVCVERDARGPGDDDGDAGDASDGRDATDRRDALEVTEDAVVIDDGDAQDDDGDAQDDDGDAGSDDDGDAGSDDDGDAGSGDDGDAGSADDGDAGSADDGDAGSDDDGDAGVEDAAADDASDEDEDDADVEDADVEDAEDEDADDSDDADVEDASDDGGDTEDAPDGDAGTADGGVTGDGCAATVASPNGGDPAYAIPICDPRCSKFYAHWGFWVTQYNVGNTLGFGEHQGLATIGYRYTYDERGAWDEYRRGTLAIHHPWRDKHDHLWTAGSQTFTVAAQFKARITAPNGESASDSPELNLHVVRDRALCSIDQIADTRLYNHGRSIAYTVPTHPADAGYSSRGLIPLRLLDHIALYTSADSASFGTCAADATDGYCDSVCGNCSYVVPSSGRERGTLAGKIARQVVPAPQLEGAPAQTISYLGGVLPNVGARNAFVNKFILGAGGWEWLWLPDPFTHCDQVTRQNGAWVATGTSQSYTSRTGYAISGDYYVTGKYGHNSNTDAAAQYAHFQNCKRDPVVGRSVATERELCTAICGGPTFGVGNPFRQFPCVAASDTSASSWGPTHYTAGVGIHDIDDTNLGLWPTATPPINWIDRNRPQPQCRHSASNQVWGM